LPSFRGKIDRTTPYEYLRQLRLEAEANGISMEAMLNKKIPTLMIKEAANWFAVNRAYFTSWEEFQRLFMEEYCCPNYKEQLLRDLEKRSQDPKESGTVFLHKIVLLCREIDPTTPDWFIIRKIAKQLHPEYRNRLHPVLQAYPSLRHFAAHVAQIQSDLYDMKTYKPPPPPHEFAEPAFAYTDHKVEFRVQFQPLQGTQQSQSNTVLASDQQAPPTTAVSISSLNPQITRQRAQDAHSKAVQQKQQGAYNKQDSQQFTQGDRSRSPFKNQGSSSYRGYSPGGKNWVSPNGSRWARSASPQRSGGEGENKNKFSNYQSPSRPADGQHKQGSPYRSQSHDPKRSSSPHRPTSPSRLQAKVATADEGKN
jgi:hypothetical protein